MNKNQKPGDVGAATGQTPERGRIDKRQYYTPVTLQLSTTPIHPVAALRRLWKRGRR